MLNLGIGECMKLTTPVTRHFVEMMSVAHFLIILYIVGKELWMPTIKIIKGVRIEIHPNEHGIPHFHARYQKQDVSIAIKTLKIIDGKIPKAKLKDVIFWAFENREELLAIWNKYVER